MKEKVGSSKNMSNYPQDMDELVKELDSMSLEELKEEFGILYSDMDEHSFDGDLLKIYLDAIERKDPQPPVMDAQTSYEHFLKRLKAQEREDRKRRRFHGLLKTAVIAAVIAALLAASVAVAYAKGFDLFDRIARWTAETFGFSSEGSSDNGDVNLPPELVGIKEALEQDSISPDYLPTYWPEGYEQSQVISSEGPEVNTISGMFGESGNRIVLSYIQFLSGTPNTSYNIDNQSLDFYEHNGIKFHVMTNTDKFLAVWTLDNVECRISGVESYEELIKILDSIGD